ncbi:protein argonaute-2 [Episyrphus balteatus]|nr:protein argonaute-2 [Episyrphus balteatus]
MGKKNKKGGGDGGDPPKENNPPKGGGGGSGNQPGPGSSGNQQKKESKQHEGGGPQQQGGGAQKQGGGPQQQGGGPQKQGGGPQQQGGGPKKQGGGPQQQGGGPQKQGGGPQQQGGGPQQQRGGPQQQGGGGPQQQGGGPQQQRGGPQQQGGGGPQQQRGGPQQQGAWGQQQQGGGGQQQQRGGPQQQAGGPQQQRGGPQQQGGWGQQQQGGGGPQQQRGGPQQQGGWGQQQQGGGGPQQQKGGGGPQQQRGGPQQQGGWGQQQQGGGGPQQQRGGPQQQGGWGQQQQGGGGPQQQGGWGQQQQGGGGRDVRSQSQQSGGSGDGGSRGSGGGGRGGFDGGQRGRGGYQGGRGGGGGGGDRGYQGGGGDRGYQGGDRGYQGGGGDRGGGGGRGGRGGGGRGGGRDQGGYQQGPPSSNAVVRVPKPPTNGIQRGTRGQPFELETNYLMMNLKNMPDVAYHYDVKIDPDRPKKFMRDAFDAYVKKIFPNHDLAYDGKANAYSPVLLATDKLGSEITVEVNERDRKIPFKVTLKATDDVEIDLKSIKTASYHTERIFDKPMRALQCIEVVLSTPCHLYGVRAGRSFFKEPRDKIDLGDGFELWYGLYQAAMLCDQPLLNVDVSHKSFPSKVNLVNFYENLRFQDPRALNDLLKGLRVTYKPPAVFKSVEKEFKFVGVKDASNKQTFKTDDGKQLTVEQYFQSKGCKLQKPHLPCIHVGSTVKNIYIPLEFLEVPPGQAIMRKDNENQVRQMIRHAATSTDVRKAKIMDLLRSFNYYMHPTVERFGISVDKNFITVSARLLSSPAIEYSQGRNINIDRPGEWMNRGVRFYKCDSKTTHKWAIINISQKQDINAMFLREHFVEKISREADKLGMSLARECSEIREIQGRGRAPPSILPDLKKFKTDKLSIVFVILPFAAEAYGRVKQEAELSCGIVTQCIKGDTIRSYNKRFNQDKIIDQMTIGNILLKVNAKLNGTNHKISPSNEINLQKSKVMFVGADVSHPSPLQVNLPSIVGVVASHDLHGTQYNMQYRLQTAKLETIEDMQNIMTQHLNVFRTSTGCLPDHVIYYRDGVSDGQFPLIKQIEVNAMRAACKAMKCSAKFTVIIVVKRHHTRFFPKSSDGEGKYNNVKAGTIVDQTICHPNETQFFLVSHKAIQGTSKPTRYNVIIDDANINIDDLQAMTYNLCHLFPRCNRSVSYPAPAYLAHLVGLRGRAYIEGSNLQLENLKAEYSKRAVSNDIMKCNPMFFV